jgi:phosphatidylglycerophosphate synthase
MPAWVTSDMLTAFGLFGSVITFLGFILARFCDRCLLLISIIGFIINWFGDSLDGRLAYYRNKPRKWYGFSLDFCTDWITAILIGLGYLLYDNSNWELFGFIFAVLYGLEMMIALLRYKIINAYSIDSGILGPTEVRIILALILILEVVVPGSIVFSVIGGSLLLVVTCASDFMKLLKMADARDKEERKAKSQANITTADSSI